MLKKTINIRLLSFLLIALSAVVIYSNSFDCVFHFDDREHILEDFSIRDLTHFSKINTWSDINSRPLSKFTFALNYKIHKISEFGYHLVNLIIHIISGIFVFLLVDWILFLLSKDDINNIRNRKIISLFSALIFVAHPLQTQAVTYIIQRMTSLAGMFYLISIYTYARGRFSHTQNETISRPLAFYILSIISGLLALFCKQNAVTFPAAMLLFEFFFVRDKEEKHYWRYTIILFALISSIFLVIVTTGNLPREVDSISRGDYLITQFKVIVMYIQLLVFPINQNLEHDFPVSHSLWDFKVMGSMIFILLIIYIGIWFYRRDKGISFGIFWFFLTLSVESSIIPIRDVIVEHRLYLPMFGFSIAITGLLSRIFSRKRFDYLIALLTVVVLAFGIAAYNRNKIWKTSNSLWSDVVKKSPNKVRVYNNMGNTLLESGNLTGALANFNRVLNNTSREDEIYTYALYNVGYVFFKMGDYVKSNEIFKSVLEIEPEHLKALINLGIIAENISEYDSAIKYYRRAHEIQPEDGTFLYNLGNVYLMKGEYDTSISYYMKTIEIIPEHAISMHNMGICYFEKGDLDNAIKYLRKALELMPNNKNFLDNLRKVTEAMNK